MSHRKILATFLATILVVAVTGIHRSAIAGTNPGRVVDPGQESTIFTNSDVPDDQTGITFLNLGTTSGTVDVVFREGSPLGPNDQVAEDFVLLDNYLDITSSNIPDGAKRLQVRMEYSGIRVRRLGLRANSIRMLRLNERLGRWRPAIRAIRNQSAADIRRIRGLATGRLGNYGIDEDGQYAWAVVDVTSQYALGARPVPEPVSWGLLASGMGILLLVRRRKRV